MEKILLVSDTHNNLKLLKDVLKREDNCSTIFHLGDNYDDLDRFTEYVSNKTIVKVPGIFYKGYKDRSVKAIQLYNSNEWKLLLVHDLNDALSKTQDTDIYLYGHTHRTDFVKQYGKYFLNPGHLKNYKDRGTIASYAILEISKKSLKIFVKNYKGFVIYNNIIEK